MKVKPKTLTAIMLTLTSHLFFFFDKPLTSHLIVQNREIHSVKWDLGHIILLWYLFAPALNPRSTHPLSILTLTNFSCQDVKWDLSHIILLQYNSSFPLSILARCTRSQTTVGNFVNQLGKFGGYFEANERSLVGSLLDRVAQRPDSFQNSWQQFSKIYSWCPAQVTSVAINCSISFQKFSQVPHSNILNLILCEKEADVSQFTKAAFGGVPTVVVYPFYHGRLTPVNLQHPSVTRWGGNLF